VLENRDSSVAMVQCLIFFELLVFVTSLCEVKVILSLLDFRSNFDRRVLTFLASISIFLPVSPSRRCQSKLKMSEWLTPNRYLSFIVDFPRICQRYAAAEGGGLKNKKRSLSL